MAQVAFNVSANLTPDAFTLLPGRRYNRVKRNREANLKQNSPKDQIDPSEPTADRLAAEHGVSSATVKRTAKFAIIVTAEPQHRQGTAGHRERRDRDAMNKIHMAQALLIISKPCA